MKYSEEIMWSTVVLFLVVGSAGHTEAQSAKGHQKFDSGMFINL